MLRYGPLAVGIGAVHVTVAARQPCESQRRRRWQGEELNCAQYAHTLLLQMRSIAQSTTEKWRAGAISHPATGEELMQKIRGR